ncbi:MAG: hypothetical protein KF732_09460 [Flavobacteriales bacterium]|nr:hypothetical protein [Flavobacteriales bacterium]
MADVFMAYDYYAFGSLMPGRTYNSGSYRYGFQGQEKENDVVEGGFAFKYRIHDARVGRFLSIDPLTKDYPHNSPFAFSENRVIDGVELEGLEYLKKNEAIIYLGAAGLFWRTAVTSQALDNAITTQHFSIKQNYDKVNTYKSLNTRIININDLEKDFFEHLQAALANGFQGDGSKALEGTDFGIQSKFESTQVNTKFTAFDGRYKRTFDNLQRIESKDGKSIGYFTLNKGATMMNIVTVASEALNIIANVYNDVKISRDVTTAEEQVPILTRSILAFYAAQKVGIIPEKIMNAFGYNQFQIDVINYIFSGTLPEENRALSFKNENGEFIGTIWSQQYRQLIATFGKQIYKLAEGTVDDGTGEQTQTQSEDADSNSDTDGVND